jgi:hypothetical protein
MGYDRLPLITHIYVIVLAVPSSAALLDPSWNLLLAFSSAITHIHLRLGDSNNFFSGSNVLVFNSTMLESGLTRLFSAI